VAVVVEDVEVHAVDAEEVAAADVDVVEAVVVSELLDMAGRHSVTKYGEYDLIWKRAWCPEFMVC